jgi:hypothetical protein
MFQSTRPCGARHDLPYQRIGVNLVSIHTPLRGATRLNRADRKPVVFQSTRPAGRDFRVSSLPSSRSCFNPHAPAGRDQRGFTPSLSMRCFNPHAPCGARPSCFCWASSGAMFQSTRPCGARPSCRCNSAVSGLFQSTRPCGARPHPEKLSDVLQLSMPHARTQDCCCSILFALFTSLDLKPSTTSACRMRESPCRYASAIGSRRPVGQPFRKGV